MLSSFIEILKEVYKNLKNLKFLGKIQKLKSQRGTISIISIGIFLILMVFILIMYLIIQGVMADIRANTVQEEAEQVADNVIQHITDFIDENELVGYNAEFHCEFNFDGVAVEGDEICNEFTAAIGDAEEVVVDGEIQGRLENPVPTEGACGDFFFGFQDCFVVPYPGTGNAGVDCELYDPFESEIIDLEEVNNIPNFDNLDHPCNWNKLNENNSEIVVDLYHHEEVDFENFEVINPLEDGELGFLVRVRPSCLPENQDNICENNSIARYQIERNPPDFNYVLDWKFLGNCLIEDQEEECSFYYDAIVNGNRDILDFLVLNEAEESLKLDLDDLFGKNNIQDNQAPIHAMFGDPNLSNFTSPQFIINIVDSELNFNEYSQIPELEYQILTDEPISNLNYKLNLNINGISSELTIFH